MFYTSILSTNRQVYNESSNIFYMENLFIRVNSDVVGRRFEPDALGDYEDDAGRNYGLPVLSKGSKAQACTRDAMEIDLIAGLESALLLMDGWYQNKPERLQESELWIIIGDEIGIAGEQSAVSDSFCDGRTAGYLTAATKNAAANREGPIKHLRTAIERNAPLCQDTNGSGGTTLNVAMDAKPRMSQSPNSVSSPRIRRLLEPFRAVYSFGFPYIDAPYQRAVSARDPDWLVQSPTKYSPSSSGGILRL
ncbi:MAG: hypothetical protein ALECFALPRED_007633 [Alectoria fallacina]|uniref:Uncharacterized protein n=1 Tax=Alectoria fallacina TaxID=1903189 RepID=A0A8H3ES51_9LECA|nr:MAG: hypothetical protein ALECFALPRED_007633 [Alectoria fallacina]